MTSQTRWLWACSLSALMIAAGAVAQKSPGDAARVEKIPGSLVKFEMVRIPAGRLGDATIGPFWISRTEVTWEAYDIFAFSLDLTEKQRADNVDAESRPSKPYGNPDRGFGHQGYPAVSIAHQGAHAYCVWLSAKTGRKYRLPTEAEWEYTCRAGGDGAKLDRAALDKVAWFLNNSDEKTHPVGKKAPNAWRLHDMLGNAGEWADTPDGRGVVCGGSFQDPADEVHAGARAKWREEWQQSDPQDPKSKWWLSDGPHVGFRVVCDDAP